MVGAFMEVLTEETDETPFVTPVNEISFIAWAGGDFAYINPFAKVGETAQNPVNQSSDRSDRISLGSQSPQSHRSNRPRN